MPRFDLRQDIMLCVCGYPLFFRIVLFYLRLCFFAVFVISWNTNLTIYGVIAFSCFEIKIKSPALVKWCHVQFRIKLRLYKRQLWNSNSLKSKVWQLEIEIAHFEKNFISIIQWIKRLIYHAKRELSLYLNMISTAELFLNLTSRQYG